MNVTALVNTSGTVVERYLYDPYGKVTITNHLWSVITWANSKKNEILYCGYRFDPETGLFHVRHRYYHPTLGRPVTRDPLEYAYAESTLNLYEYTYSSPGCYTDPLGTVARIPMDPEPCGKFIIREASVPIRDPNEQRRAGATSGRGFEVQFDPKGCEKKCLDSIRLVQAIASTGAYGAKPHFDVSDDDSRKNKNTPGGTPPPEYPGEAGLHGRLSYRDAPLDTHNTTRNSKTGKGGTKWYLTTCAVGTKESVDTIINCVNFTFDDGTKKTDVPGAKPHVDDKTKKSDGVETQGAKPGYPWEDTFWSKGAMSDWIESAGKEAPKGK